MRGKYRDYFAFRVGPMSRKSRVAKMTRNFKSLGIGGAAAITNSIHQREFRCGETKMSPHLRLECTSFVKEMK